MNRLIKQYLGNNSWRKKENANTNESFSNLQFHIVNNIMAKEALYSLPKRVMNAHSKGDIHVHNLESGFYIPYCAGHSLKSMLMNGIKTSHVSSKPAKHFASAVDHVMNFLFMSQMEFAGAQSFSDVDTLLAPYIKKDKLTFKEVKQHIQKLVYNLNYTMRAASQTPFTNITLNLGVPNYLKGERVVFNGTKLDIKYDDCIDEIFMFNQALAKVLSEKDPEGRPFTFPIPTLNIGKSFPWNEDVVMNIFDEISELGSYYFMNYVGSGIDEDTIRSMCCRLNLDMSTLNGPRGLWNTGEGTGSLGVCTINFPRLGYLAKSDEDFFVNLTKLMDYALKAVLVRKRKVMEYMDRLMPFSVSNGWSYKNYFVTIGVIGFNEMCMNYTGTNILQNSRFVTDVLNHMRRWSKRQQKDLNQLINIEMIPGEGSSYRLAYIDTKRHKGIKTLGTPMAPYYTSLLIPPSIETNMFERIRFEQEILPLFSGGTIFRTYLGEEKPDNGSLKSFMSKLIKGSKIPYSDITCTFSVCRKEGKTFNKIAYECPDCGSDTEVYSRVVGYYRPLNKWNIGKREEFGDRLYLNGFTST